MKKNLYYQTMYARRNVLKSILLNLFIGVSSMPRLLLEVFIRRNFGERYFSFSTAIWMILLLGGGPIARLAFGYHFTSDVAFDFIGKNWSLYVYLGAFLFVCLKRREEVYRLPSVFDFARFSLSTGEISPVFYSVIINGQTPSVRTIETMVEPSLFFVIGLLLILLGQNLGYIILPCSIIYSLSYVAAYYLGDNFVMDKIDEMICNEEMVSAFVEGRNPSETRGFNPYGRKPTDPEDRRKVVDFMTSFDEFGTVL